MSLRTCWVYPDDRPGGVSIGKVIADISMSLDGYVAARDVDEEDDLGIGGEAIHVWVLEEPRSPVDAAVLAHSSRRPALW